MAMFETLNEHAAHSSASYVVHPTTLDGLFQLIFVALTRGGNTKLQTMVPTRIGRVWVSSLAEETFSPVLLEVYPRARLLNKRSAQCCITALDDLSQSLRIQIQDLETTAVSGYSPSLLEHQDAKKLCYHVPWKPDLDTLSFQSIQKICESFRQDEVEPIHVTVSVLILGMPSLRSTRWSDLHDRQIYTIVRLVTQVNSDKSRLTVSLIYGVWLFSWF